MYIKVWKGFTLDSAGDQRSTQGVTTKGVMRGTGQVALTSAYRSQLIIH